MVEHLPEKLPEGGLPMHAEPVEVPELVRFAHWAWNHLLGEGQMIRRAPLALIILSAIIASGLHWLDNKSHNEEVSSLDNVISTKDATIQKQDENERSQATTISSLQNTIAQLNEELKGTSPQLAAIQASRDEIRKHLQRSYVEGGELWNRAITTPADVDALDLDVGAWSERTSAWIESNMGVAAKERFLDPGQLAGLSWSNSVNQKHNNIRNFLINTRKNLSTLIETAAWDGQPANKN
jgi:hypothetical protein